MSVECSSLISCRRALSHSQGMHHQGQEHYTGGADK